MSDFTTHDAFMATVLPAITQEVMRAYEDFLPAIQMQQTADLAPEIAACARRIADAVIEERTLMPGGVE